MITFLTFSGNVRKNKYVRFVDITNQRVIFLKKKQLNNYFMNVKKNYFETQTNRSLKL